MQRSHYFHFSSALQFNGKEMLMKKNIDILLITGGAPSNNSIATNIDKLSQILLNITDNIYLITFCNNKIISSLDNENIYFLKWYSNRFKLFKAFLYIYRQILVSKMIISLYKTNNIKIVLFAFGQDVSIFPMITAKIAAKKTIIRSDGRLTLSQKKYFKTLSVIERYFFKIIEEINYRLSDVILTECEYMILENNFQNYNIYVT
jgi:hypothetical protein